MSRLIWGATTDRKYEAGIDRGVLFVDSHYEGLPWNGLSAIKESPSGGSPTAYYVDGFKYANIASAEEFEATIEAFGAPSEFDQCDGVTSPYPGLMTTQQVRKPFHLSYRTLIGDANMGIARGYKLHLVYTALTTPSSRENVTMGSSVSPTLMSWDITTSPIDFPGIRPTSHFVIDSTAVSPVILAYIEAVVYGADNMFSRMPESETLISLFGWEPLIEIDYSATLGGIRYDSDFLLGGGSRGEMWIYDGDVYIYNGALWAELGPDPL